MRATIDLATELAEGFALDPFGIPLRDIQSLSLTGTGKRFHERHGWERFDTDTIRYISSAHLSCGLHSGDPVLIRRTAVELQARGISLGAHPSYPDGFGFGQVRIAMTASELESVLLYQLGALSAVLAGIGSRIAHVKCHGALQHDVSYEEEFCAPLVHAIQVFDAELPVIFMGKSPGLEFARAKGLRVASEGYVDRAYDRNGRIVPRGQPGALITQPEVAVQHVIEMACHGTVTCIDGAKIDFPTDSLCLHSDTPGAGAIAAAVVAALTARGVRVAALEAR